LEVFIYLDRNNQLRATSREPFAEVGQFALLQVSSIGPHGAFLDWGLEKDLLSPFSEQPQKMLEGRRYLVYLCHDQQGRPIASARLEKFVEIENQDLKEGDEVELLIWTFTDLGAKVIVNDRYEALLYRDELPAGLKRGDRGQGYVARIREDRRIDVALRRPGAAGVADARDVILSALREEGGFLALHDNSPPELIRSQLGLSKKQFKKALGGLYKEKQVELSHKGVRLLK
jgi:predicted RNA-binding protein (virulence factor B family)